MDTLAERLQSLSPEQRALFELRLKEKKLKIPALKIPRAPRGGDLPLSFAQQRFWLLQHLSPESSLYNTYLPVRLTGPLKIRALEQSVHEIVQRHEVLHTTFSAENGQPVQRPNPALKTEIRIIDLQQAPGADKDGQARELLLSEIRKPFNLRSELPLRVLLALLAQDEQILLVTMHHVVSDRWSIDVLMSELSEAYEAYSHNRTPKFAELPIQYADFAAWQRQRMKGELLQQHLSYWKRQLQDLEPLDLPVDNRPTNLASTASSDGSLAYLRLDPQLVENLTQIGRRQGATLFMTTLALFEALLFRYTGADDLAIGAPVTDRNNPETKGLIGCFINTLVLRTSLSGNPSFCELLRRVKQTCLDAYTWQELPFERLVEELQPQRNANYSQLFRVILTLNDAHEPLHGRNLLETTLHSSGLQMRPFEIDTGAIAADAADLILRIERLKTETVCMLEYRTRLFRHTTIVRMLEHFRMLLDAVLADPLQRLGDLPLLTEAERRKILVDWNGAATPYPGNMPVHELFEAQAKRRPDAVAVEFEDGRITYRELNEKANRLAYRLRELGIGPEHRVAIFLNRSPDLIISLLATLKAGGAYLPLDVNYPEERLSFMLEDADATLLITTTSLLEWLPGATKEVICLEVDWSEIAEHRCDNLQINVRSDNLAYVMYTSGSTGKPKGVMVTHRAIGRLVLNCGYADFNDEDRVAFAANPAFDAATMEVWAPLLNGGRIVVIDQDCLLDPQSFAHTLKRREVTVLWLTVGLFNQYARTSAEAFGVLRYLIVGGDALDPRTIARVLDHTPPQHLVNGYGPTETTTFAATHEIREVSDGALSIPLGRPISNTQIYILDASQDPAPTGISGELYVGGAGVARGYLNRPGLTVERFLPDSFGREPGARIYRTGDLGRWLPDGEIDFLGRNDFQVKVRGFRVELGEIEAQLAEHEAVREAVVVVREDTVGDRRLVAYYTGAEENGRGKEGIKAEQLRMHLLARLPEHMAPAAYVRLEKLPLTPNGKVDRKALPAPEGDAYGAHGYEELQGEIEEALAGVWAEALNLERVGRHDDFFELGGHSLLAVEVIMRLQQILNVEVTITDFFKHTALADLARVIESAGQAPLPQITPAQGGEHLPLSFAQQRLWIVANLEPESAAYNIPFGLRLKGRLNVEALRRSLREILRRHQALRAVFPERDGEPIQEITEADLAFSTVDLSLVEDSEKQKTIQQLTREEGVRPFDLGRGPLFRVTLIQVNHKTEHILLVTMHHVVSDGWSIGVLLKEFGVLYRAFCEGAVSPLRDPEIQYADYARWQREWLQGDILQEHLEYWGKRLENLPVFDLPLDYPRPTVSNHQGKSIAFVVPSITREKLQTLTRQENVSPFMLLVAAFQLMLSRYCQQQDVIVGADVACRDRAETENLVGFFVNQLALRAKVKPTQSFRRLLRQVKETTLGAYAYQNLPFEKLVEELAPARELNRHPLFQCKIAIEYIFKERLEFPELQIDALESAYHFIKTDIRLVMNEAPAFSGGRFEYAVDLFSRDTMRRFMERWLALLDHIATAPDRPLTELDLLTAAERKWLLVERNATGFEFPVETVCDQFERQARVRPDAIAVVFEDRQVTFAGLNAQANQLARYLRQCGVGPESFVALCVERSFEMILGLLGVWKAGGAYVPLDPDLPPERMRSMLNETQPALLLTKRRLLAKLEDITTKIICLDSEWERISIFPTVNPQPGPQPQVLAYALYTSGSTGAPKGVMVNHASLANYVAAIIRRAELKPEFSYALAQTLTVDLGVTTLFPPLCLGGSLHVISEEAAMNGRALAEYFDRHGIDCLKIAPTHLAALHASWSSRPSMPRRRLILGGEVSNHDWVTKLAKENPDCAIFNHYGPTETTVGVLTYRITGAPGGAFKTVPLERPLANTEVYVLDEHGQPAPVCIPGELYIGGKNVSRGYLKQPSLTAERFIPDPFSGIPGSSLYRTGDLARLSPEGLFECLGRIDDQVKIRGFRVELREIEAVLLEHPNVAEAIVTSRDAAPGDKQLAAYIVARRQPAPSQVELRNFASRYLPQHMIPLAFVVLDEMPRLPHGKLDRKALPNPVFSTYFDDGFVPPRSPSEELLAGIWQKLLGQERIGVYDNFFDLGGNSLIAIQVISQIRQLFRIELSFRAIFASQTLADLARAVEEEQRKARGSQRPAIAPMPRTHVLPLSFAQKRLWFIHSLDPDDPAYLAPVVMRLTGGLDVTVLQMSFDELIERHEALRTTFPVENHQPIQSISAVANFQLVKRDLRAFADHDRDQKVRDCIDRASREPFDLAIGPLLRAQLLQVSDREYVLVLVLHHIISDGWSAGILIQELAALYEAFSSGGASPLSPLAIQYADFAMWQAGWLQGEELDRLLTYWTKKLANSSVLRFPPDYHIEPSEKDQSRRLGSCSINLGQPFSQKLKGLARQEGATDFMTLLAAFTTLLVRYTGQEDINIGTPVAGRTQAEIEPLIGFFVNTLVLRIQAGGNPDFHELVGRVKEVAIEAYERHELPFEKLVEELQPARAMTHTPLFDVMFVLQNTPRRALKLPNLEMTQIEVEPAAGKFNLMLVMRDTEAGFTARLEYNGDRFATSVMERFLSHFERLLREFADNPSQRLMEAQLLDASERRQVLIDWNRTATSYPGEAPVHEIFETQAKRCPDAVAIEFEDRMTTYRELNEKANQLAWRLRKLGIGPEHRVAVCLRRSPDLVISLLATLKAGGAYLPLDAGYPKERLKFMLEDADATLLITAPSLLERLPVAAKDVICLDADWPEIAERHCDNLQINVRHDNLAYVMYTSGSTGTPKGVAVTHQNVVRLVQGNSFASMDPDEVFFQFAPVSFDASTFEIWGALLNGAKLVICPVQDPSLSELGEILQMREVTTLWLTAGLFRLMVDEQLNSLSRLRQLLAGGDALSAPHVRRVVEKLSCRLINGYGPTENTTFSCCHTISRQDHVRGSIPIGRPIANGEAYVLDQGMQPAPVGVIGELYVGGEGLARGYIGRPEMTAESFAPHLYSERGGARLYRTGDWARYRENGELEFAGRKDGQVKIRGFRVELGEIEAALLRHPEVKEAVALARGAEEKESGVGPEKRIVAYVVVKDQDRVSDRELREYIRGMLPEYMTPSGWVMLEEAPLTANGKVDREALKRYKEGRGTREEEYLAPRTEIERKIVELWQELLLLERVGVQANFFDLGGHSLLATQMVSLLQQAFSIRIPLRLVFESPTIAQLAEDIEALLWMVESGETLPITAMNTETGDQPPSS